MLSLGRAIVRPGACLERGDQPVIHLTHEKLCHIHLTALCYHMIA